MVSPFTMTRHKKPATINNPTARAPPMVHKKGSPRAVRFCPLILLFFFTIHHIMPISNFGVDHNIGHHNIGHQMLKVGARCIVPLLMAGIRTKPQILQLQRFFTKPDPYNFRHGINHKGHGKQNQRGKKQDSV